MMPCPPTPTVRPLREMPKTRQPVIACYAVDTEFVDGLGQIATHSQLIYASTHNHVKALIHDKYGTTLRGLRIILKSVKNCPSK